MFSHFWPRRTSGRSTYTRRGQTSDQVKGQLAGFVTNSGVLVGTCPAGKETMKLAGSELALF